MMASYRSKSCRDGREMQLENYNYGTDSQRDLAIVPSGKNHDLPRSYSTNHASASSVHPPPPPGYNNSNFMMGKEMQIKKMKNNQGSIGKSWSFNDPELKRKKRVAGYKVYAVEGKVKGSFKKSFRWIKDIVYGWK